MKKIRVGLGYDVHRLAENEELWLGGIKIPHFKGSVGHSDADVILHVICDAMLGALNLRDIGFHFPDTDPKYKGIDSKKLLSEVAKLINDKGYEIGNIDVTLSLQKPKVMDYIEEMKRVTAEILHIDVEDISIKATTTEKLGFEGREEGVSAQAVCLLYEK
ncbi:2-C-methyl-D-erythritol 2,4-cyclodiphosphate synthase [Hyphobacterium sp. CCMP332]|nr:2-C-methyl-D-erythritol 2,4-cyclodiphosphate synthase [Hyphobacterium sp. CCMP332]